MASWHRVPIQSNLVALADYLENIESGEAAADKLREMRRGTVTNRIIQGEKVDFQAQKVIFLENYVVDTALAGYPQLRKLVMAQPDIETGKSLADQINAVLNADPPTPSADQILANFKAGAPLGAMNQAIGVGNPVAHGQAPVAPPAPPVVAAPAAAVGFTTDPQVLADRATAQAARTGAVTDAELWKAAPVPGASPVAQIDELSINTVLALASAQRRLNHGTFDATNGYLEPNRAVQMDMPSLQTFGAVVLNGRYLADEFATEGFLKLCFWNAINPADQSLTPAAVQAYGLILAEGNVKLSRTAGKRKSLSAFWTGRGADPTQEMRGYGMVYAERKGKPLVLSGPQGGVVLGTHTVDQKHFEGGRLTLYSHTGEVAYSHPMTPGLKLLLGSPTLTKARFAVIKGEGAKTVGEYRKILNLTHTHPKGGKRHDLITNGSYTDSDSDSDDEGVTPSKTLSHRLKIITEELQAGNRSKKMVAEAHRIILTLWERGDINSKERTKLEELLPRFG